MIANDAPELILPLDKGAAIPAGTLRRVAPRCRVYHAWARWGVDRASVSVGTALFGSGPLTLPAIRNIRECTRCGLTQTRGTE